jgi:predicted outer membrane protein
MKTIHKRTNSFSRRQRPWTIAVFAGCLGVATVSAQESSPSAPPPEPIDPSSSPSAPSDIDTSRRSYEPTDTRSARDSARTEDTSSLKRADRKFITKAAESSQKEVAIAQLAAQRATRPEVRSHAQELASDHQRLNSELVQLAQRKGLMLDSSRAATTAASSSGVDASRNAGVAMEHGAPRGTGAAGTAGTGAATGVEPNASTATSGSPGAGSDASSTAALPADIASDRQYRKLAKKSGADFDREYVDVMVDHHERDVQLFQKAAKDAQDSDVRSFASSHLPALQAHLDRANSLKGPIASAAE